MQGYRCALDLNWSGARWLLDGQGDGDGQRGILQISLLVEEFWYFFFKEKELKVDAHLFSFNKKLGWSILDKIVFKRFILGKCEFTLFWSLPSSPDRFYSEN